jgi:7-cyano-7-deazaguanine synthase in queuosine biosynthesis
MSNVLLFSAGLDSFPAWHYLDKPPALYFDIRHRYHDQERASIRALADRCGIEVTVSRELDLSRWEADDAIIPLRNVYFAMLAANRAEEIWCVGVKGDGTADKSPAAFHRISHMITDLMGRRIVLDSPFWTMTKTEIIAWYLGQGLPVADLLLTFSCSRGDGLPMHCGRCSSCLRRWISLVNNGVNAPFEADPWTWERVTDHYVPAMRNGMYPDHRASEFFAALDAVGFVPPSPTGQESPEEARP